MNCIDIDKAKTNFYSLVERVQKGEEIVITRAGKPVAKLTSINPERQLGILKGRLILSEDFDAPLPDEIIQAFEPLYD